MDGVELITIPEEVAKAKLKAIRASLHREADERYKRTETLYREAAKGRPLVDLADTFADPATDEKGRPRLAIARADRPEVRLFAGYGEEAYRFDAREDSWQFGGKRCPQQDLTFRRRSPATWSEGYAPVPMIPAEVRPATGELADWFILWEVDHWADRSKRARPPRDPYLLKPLGGTLYAVLAAWDLTDLERAVMAEALRA